MGGRFDMDSKIRMSCPEHVGEISITRGHYTDGLLFYEDDVSLLLRRLLPTKTLFRKITTYTTVHSLLCTSDLR